MDWPQRVAPPGALARQEQRLAPRMPAALPAVLGRAESTAPAAPPLALTAPAIEPTMAEASSTTVGVSAPAVAATACRTACESGPGVEPTQASRWRSCEAMWDRRSDSVRAAGCAWAAAVVG